VATLLRQTAISFVWLLWTDVSRDGVGLTTETRVTRLVVRIRWFTHIAVNADAMVPNGTVQRDTVLIAVVCSDVAISRVVVNQDRLFQLLVQVIHKTAQKLLRVLHSKTPQDLYSAILQCAKYDLQCQHVYTSKETNPQQIHCCIQLCLVLVDNYSATLPTPEIISNSVYPLHVAIMKINTQQTYML